MKNTIFLIGILISGCNLAFGQVGIGTTNPDTSALLDLDTSLNPITSKRGFLMPRMTNAQRDAIVSPAVGLAVYSLDDLIIYSFNGINWENETKNVYNTNYQMYDFGDRSIGANTSPTLYQISGMTLSYASNDADWAIDASGTTITFLTSGTYIIEFFGRVEKTGDLTPGAIRYVIRKNGSNYSTFQGSYGSSEAAGEPNGGTVSGIIPPATFNAGDQLTLFCGEIAVSTSPAYSFLENLITITKL